VKIAAVVAAAGSSSRMGACKALLPFTRNLAFVRRLAEVYVVAGADPVVITLPDDDGSEPRVRAHLAGLPVILTKNDDPARALTGSVTTALTHAAAADALLISPVDCPFIDAGLVHSLIAAVRVGVAAVPIVGDTRGHPVAFSRAAFELLWGAGDIGGPRAVLQALGEDVIEVPWSDARIVEDVDTPADYQRIFGRPPKTL
jgi:molybdenum cofactor cytidylyltransferase